MTSAELRFGAKEAARRGFIDLVEAFLERLAILDWTADVTFHYATIHTAIERAGKPVGNMDLLIAEPRVFGVRLNYRFGKSAGGGGE
jgi:tRNA(fMet)-specific endonuclease VapC